MPELINHSDDDLLHRKGDPNDRSLRRIEVNVSIAKIVRERSKNVKCAEYKKAFHQCYLDHPLQMFFMCQKESRAFRDCVEKWFFDKNFNEECKEIYLKHRSEFRKTGIPQPIDFNT
ncbi:COX assembly mitochondrial protein-like protein [Sarcoptes scabiei]|uniref:COX assembly mitochondrial protein n=1 Tax=Sarcoptes scabiei TaxID=52283 RepID=A0A131ZTK7_SARSC|nr:COX assembly mitochondrial protein-like protein [Sarcoptes scabiei]